MRPGFCVVAGPAGAELFLYNGARGAGRGLVSCSTGETLVAALIGRLYYREELASELGLSPTAAAADNPAAFALEIYGRQGWKGLARLEGDFALVIVDRLSRTLVAMRDPMGAFPLYETRHGAQIAIANLLPPLLQRLPHRRLNAEAVAQFLTVGVQVNEGASARCVFDGVERLGAGCLRRMDLARDRTEVWSYWDWLDQVREPSTTRLEELAEQYAPVLRAAVRERATGGTVAAHLSGGMDSTTVALMARDELQRRPEPVPLHAISLCYERLPTLARETPYLEAAWEEPGIVVHRIAADDLLDFDSFRDPPPHDEPYLPLWRAAMDQATIAAASQSGADTLLTGLGADDLLDWQPLHIVDWVAQGRLFAAWKETCRWAWADYSTPRAVLDQFGVTAALRSRLPACLRWLLPVSTPGPLGNDSPLLVAPWLRPEFVRRHALQDRLVEQVRHRYGAGPSTRLSCALDAIAGRVGDVALWTLGAPRDLMIAHPFLDTRVIGFGLGVLQCVEPPPDQCKPLLAGATRGLLPESIRTRFRKGHFNELYYLGLARNAPHLAAMLKHPRLRTLEWLDGDILLEQIRQGAVGGAGLRSLHAVNATLSLLCWLIHQERWLAAAPLPSRSVRLPWSVEPQPSSPRAAQKQERPLLLGGS